MTESQRLIRDLWAFIAELPDDTIPADQQDALADLQVRVRDFYSTHWMDEDEEEETEDGQQQT